MKDTHDKDRHDNEVDDHIRHGIDDNPEGDASKGAALGGLGGAAVGAAAGSLAGPAGTVVGAAVGGLAGAASGGAAVGAVDQIDNDDNLIGLGDRTDYDDPDNPDAGDVRADTGIDTTAPLGQMTPEMNKYQQWDDPETVLREREVDPDLIPRTEDLDPDHVRDETEVVYVEEEIYDIEEDTDENEVSASPTISAWNEGATPRYR